MSPSTLLRTVSPSTLLRTVNLSNGLSNGSWTFYEAVNVYGKIQAKLPWGACFFSLTLWTLTMTDY